MTEPTQPLEYYACPGPMTDPKKFSALLDHLPMEIPALVEIVQGLMVHIFWADRYGLKLTDDRKREVQTRSITRKLARILESDDLPLTTARPLERRLVGNCRDFSTVLTAILRYQGVPARARCGFGTYFLPNHYEDHWVCEYWNAGEQRWVLVDAQLDALQRKALGITFNTLDVPRDQFVTAGKAWQLCRAGNADPETFGIFNMHGLWFVVGNLLRDLASLNKFELLPWDTWGAMEKEPRSADDLAQLDCAAELTLADNSRFDALRSFYENDAQFRVPPIIKSYPGGPSAVTIDLAKEEMLA